MLHLPKKTEVSFFTLFFSSLFAPVYWVVCSKKESKKWLLWAGLPVKYAMKLGFWIPAWSMILLFFSQMELPCVYTASSYVICRFFVHSALAFF
jgi:hypothetical protein